MYKAQAVSEHFVHEWDESLGEPHIVVCEKGLDQIGEAMSKEEAEQLAKDLTRTGGSMSKILRDVITEHKTLKEVQTPKNGQENRRERRKQAKKK